MFFHACRCIISRRLTNYNFKSKMTIKTFIFLDLETTGLPSCENNLTRITEVCLSAIQSNHIILGVYPRIQNKVNLCLNPQRQIHPLASKITGLYNDLLSCQPEFNSCYEVIEHFLSLNEKPICFIAHNGDRFDYPILKAELFKTRHALSDDILCVDSLTAFRQLMSQETEPEVVNVEQNIDQVPQELEDGLDSLLITTLNDIEKKIGSTSVRVEHIRKANETTPTKNTGIEIPHLHRKSNKPKVQKRNVKRIRLFEEKPSYALSECYKRLTKKEPIDAHKAECDVNMLIECVATLGQPFVEWCNENTKRFCDIPMMVPGRPIGK